MDGFKDNKENNRFELPVDGQTVFCTYRRETKDEGDVVYLTHVEAPPSLRGTGAAGRLMQGISDYAKAEDLALVPICSYAVHWLRRHPDA